MPLTRTALSLALVLATALPAAAQFTGPGAEGSATSVAAASEMRMGTYVTLEGSLINRLREDYYTFSDGTGQLRVEIEQERFGGRPVSPDDTIRITGELDRGAWGRYLWVTSLDKLGS